MASGSPTPLELSQATKAMEAAHWTTAEATLQAYLKVHPQDGPALYLLALTYFHEARPRESLNTFTEAARQQPPSALHLRIVAEDYVQLNDYDDADHWALRAVRENPADAENWYTLGRIRQTENRFADAVSCFNKALERDPHSVKAANNLGLSLEGLNQPGKAVEAYRRALDLQRNAPHPNEQPLLNLGILLTDQNHPEEALSLLQQAAAIAPADPKIHAALGTLYVRRNELPQAQVAFEAAVCEDPDNSALHFQLGQVYRREKLADKAAAELARSQQLEAAKRR